MAQIPQSLKHARFVAMDILRDYSIIEPPVNLSKIIEWEWLKLFEIPFPKDADSLSWMLDLEQKMIVVNENDADFNKPFTVAHELGHYILHRKFLEKFPEKYSVVFKKKWFDDTDFLEKEANCFASNLLVPNFMLWIYKDYLSIFELSKIFTVSPTLIEKRLTQEYDK